MIRLRSLEECRQDAEIDTFPLRCENKLSFKRRAEAMARCQQLPLLNSAAGEGLSGFTPSYRQRRFM